jgi:DNA gyrase subunit B
VAKQEYGAESIKVFKGLSAVRKRPGMYIGDTDNGDGLHHMVEEVVANSCDEALAGYCTRVKVTIHGDQSVTVQDNGRGIPVDIHPTEKRPAAEVVMTELHAGGKFDQNMYKVSGGLHGVGVSVVNALSEWAELEVHRHGNVYRQKYKRGKPATKLSKKGKTKKRGTIVRFKFDPQIFKNVTSYSFSTIVSRLRELAFLNGGLKIQIIDENSKKKASFKYDGGLLEFVKFMSRKKTIIHSSPIYIKSRADNILIEAALQWNNSYKENIRCYTNNIHNPDGGTHLAGFKAGLTRTLGSYITENKLTRGKVDFVGDDFREGLCAIVSVKLPDPKFNSQTKSKLISSEARKPIEGAVSSSLYEYFEENAHIAQNITAKIVNAAKARMAARKAREIERKKIGNDSISLAGKLANCQSKKPEECELFVVEGQSAGGSAKMGRDRRTQAILPLRGKVLNVQKVEQAVVMKNKELMDLVLAINTGIGNNFNLKKLRYNKIILMTDSDVDGSHISCLLLTFFHNHMRSLIEHGHVYLAQPPLYKIKRGKVEKYIHNETEMSAFIVDKGTDGLRVKMGRKQLPDDDIKYTLSILDNKEQIIRGIKKVGSIEVIDSMIEAKLTGSHFKDKSKLITKLKEANAALKRKNPSLRIKYFFGNSEIKILTPCGNISESTWNYMVSAYKEYNVANGDVIVTTISPQILSSDVVRKYIEAKKYSNSKFIIVDGAQKHSIGSGKELIKFVKERGSRGLTIQRYKGLGEMNAEQLWETTMNPATRNMLQLEITDREDCDAVFDLLMGANVEPRRKFIEENALSARNIDI